MKIPTEVSLIFKSDSAFRQTNILDTFYDHIEIDRIDKAELSEFLLSITKTGANDYIKRSALIILCDLSLSGEFINPYNALGALHNFLNQNDNDFFLITAIKYISILSNEYEQTYINRLKELSDHDSGDVASEALYWLGFIELVTNCNFKESDKVIQALLESKRYFSESFNAVENRVDAGYYLMLISFLESSLKMNITAAKTIFKEIKSRLLVKKFYELDVRNMEIDFSMFMIIKNIEISLSELETSNTWHNYEPKIRILLNSQKEIEKVRVSVNNVSKILTRILSSVINNISEILYRDNLKGNSYALQSLNREITDSELNTFLDYLIDLIPKKEIEHEHNPTLLAGLTEIYGRTEALVKYNNISEKNDANQIVEAFIDLKNKLNSSSSEFVSGSTVGEQVFYNIKGQLLSVLDNISNEKCTIFLRILEEIIRYVRLTNTDSSKADYLFLYAEKEGGLGIRASENDLQDSMYKLLKLTRIADGFEHERAKFVDGGRVDIVYKTSIMTIPIELKKTEGEVSITKIEQNYIAQAQTYASGYDQLGFFILLDLTDKGNSPSLNFKDWFNVHHLTPSTNLTIKYPDYIVSVVIPGNKLLPSSKSVYK